MARVKVDITSNTKLFDQGMKGINSGLSSMKGAIAGAFTVGAVTTMINKQMELADKTETAAKRMKLTTDEVQALDIVADDVGTSLESIEAAFLKIEKARQSALEGDDNAIRYFQALGVSMDDLSKNYSKMNLVSKLAKASSAGETSVQGVALQGLGLKSLGAEIGLLGDQLDNFGETVDALKAKGAIMEEKDVKALADAKDQFALLTRELTVSLAPAVAFIADKLAGMQGYFTKNMVKGSEEFDEAQTMQAEREKKYYQQQKAKGKTDRQIAMELGKSSVNWHGLDTEPAVKPSKQTNLPNSIEDKPDKTAKAKKAKKGDEGKGSGDGFYSDALTVMGNMIGTSFKDLGKAQYQMDQTRKTLENQEKQLVELRKINQNYFETGLRLAEVRDAIKKLNPGAGF